MAIALRQFLIYMIAIVRNTDTCNILPRLYYGPEKNQFAFKSFEFDRQKRPVARVREMPCN